MARGENTGWKEFIDNVKNPLDESMEYLKNEIRDTNAILEKLNYAQDNIKKYTSTMDVETIADFNQRIKITTGLLGVSHNNIDKAYELITKKMQMQTLSQKLTADVTPTLDYAELDAKNTGIESILSATTAYKETIRAAIGNTEEILTEIDNRLNKLGYIEL